MQEEGYGVSLLSFVHWMQSWQKALSIFIIKAAVEVQEIPVKLIWFDFLLLLCLSLKNMICKMTWEKRGWLFCSQGLCEERRRKITKRTSAILCACFRKIKPYDLISHFHKPNSIIIHKMNVWILLLSDINQTTIGKRYFATFQEKYCGPGTRWHGRIIVDKGNIDTVR